MSSSSLEWNKIAGAVLVAVLAVKVIDIAGSGIYHPKTLEKNVIEIEGVEAAAPSATPSAPAQPENILPLLASADPAAGKKSFQKCLVCHTDEKGGPNKIGPNLWNVVGAKKQHRDDYQYSGALAKKGGTWTYQEISEFITAPSKFAPGTKMTYAGDKQAKDRANIIAYLRTQSDNPPPLPSASEAQSPQPSPEKAQ
jgi:cytochrome c